MAHEIEVFADAAAFFSNRQVPWHGLGEVVDGALTAEDALTVAHLASWNLRKVPDVALVEDNFVPVPGFSRVIRDNPFVPRKIDVLGHVSDKYEIVTNEEAFAFLDAVGEVGGAKFETAGSLHNGRRVFVTMEMPKSLILDGGDEIKNYLLVTTSHDGTAPVEAAITPIRVVCQNTLTLGMRAATSKIKVRHTVNVRDRMAEAVRTMTMAEDYLVHFQTAMQRMIHTPMGMDAVDAFLKELFPVPDKPGVAQATITRAENKRAEVRALILHSPTIQDEYRGTKYGAWQGVTEWFDYASQVKGGDDPQTRRTLRATMEDAGTVFKTAAYKMLVAA